MVTNALGAQIAASLENNQQGKVIRGDELLQMEIESIPMLFVDLIPQSGLIAEVGASDTGKSMLYRQMAIAIAKGSDFLGFRYTGRYKSVIFVATEDDAQATAFLLRKQNRTMKMTIEDARRIRFIYDVENVIEAIREALSIELADAVIIDAYSDVFTGKDSKDSTQTRQFLNEYGKIAKDFGCCVAFLHHTGKRTEDLPPSKNNAMGSQSFEAKMRLMFEFRSDRDRDDVRHLCIVKGNYLPAETKKASYVLRMDENFCFSPTGGRTPFELLAKDQPKEKAEKKSTTPSDYSECEHRDTLRGCATKANSKEQIKLAIQKTFNVSDVPSRSFFDYYIEKGWLRSVGEGRPKFVYFDESLPF